ncbi:NADH dehydrogenase [ubiquinone] flavoprotein 3, mitochondrial isoform X2 [Empidonax traillii]|uniref:NADH dehydrogenase [ubiquinone] flavoprotein 3, mitochondrial isoform X2 n=1 Tax=Empidonax traillii TaxID=164674 RepID=UPI000FFD4C1D|nr:NADH dehydrogenase [ubiquinone] flavoprotein 3, mitochondrial isoform X2 [Empidonax traillii]
MAAAAALRGGGRAATRQVLRLEARGLCTKPNKPTGTAAPPKKKTRALGEPAPEEMDNSTYKNLQHHEYHTYTFADYITVLSKFRQPQPSSGRPSPRH